MSFSTVPLIYAELLSNIRRISVIASFPTPATKHTRAQLLSYTDRQQLELIHNGESTLLTLPARIATASALLQPVVGSKEISWSLPVIDQAPSNNTVDLSDSIAAPWPASKLYPGTEILCRNCRLVVVSDETIRSWRDLPSENWAEMMDFWHCHKPSEHKTNGDHQADTHLADKGYGANNRFVAQSGVGFVDLTYFLFAEEDCDVVEFELPQEPQPEILQNKPQLRSLLCKTCHVPLGIVDTLSSGYRLYKWSLLLPTTEPSAPPLAHFLTAQLLSIASAQAVRKFIIHSPTYSKQSNAPSILHLWLFAPRLTVSFSSSSQPVLHSGKGKDNDEAPSLASSPPPPIPTSAVKIFYQPLSPDRMEKILAEADAGLNVSNANAVEEVLLPEEVVKEMYALLVASSTALPHAARVFGRGAEWNVGLLERFADDVM